MRTGIGAVRKAAAETAASGAYAGKLHYFNWKPDEVKYLRFLVDGDEGGDMLTVDFYEYVVGPQRAAETGQSFIVASDLYADDPNWHGKDWVAELGGKCKEYGTGALLDLKPTRRTVGMAVLLEEDPERSTKQKIVTRDVLEEIEVKDQKYPSRQFGVIRQAYKNFWMQLVEYHDEFGTLCDRAYKITRRGGKSDTAYSIMPKDVDPDWNPEDHSGSLARLQERYGYGHPRPEDDADRFLYCPQTLPQWADYYCSEERVRFFLLPQEDQAQEQAARNGGGLSEYKRDTTSNPDPAGDEAQAAPPPTSSDMSDLRARLERHKPN